MGPYVTGIGTTDGANAAGGNRAGTYEKSEVTYLIEAFEDVTVPAGTFRAFRARRDFYNYQPSFRTQGTRWSQRMWFAPAVKWVVKYTSTRPWEKEWELTSYQLACQP